MICIPYVYIYIYINKYIYICLIRITEARMGVRVVSIHMSIYIHIYLICIPYVCMYTYMFDSYHGSGSEHACARREQMHV